MKSEDSTGSSLKMYTLAEAAEVLGLHKRTLALWVKQGKVTCGKIGRTYLFTREDLQQVGRKPTA